MTFEQKLKADDGTGLGNIRETRREKSGRETVRRGQASGSRSNKAASVAGWVMAGGGSVLEDRPGGRRPRPSGPHGLCHALAFTLPHLGGWPRPQVSR